MRGSFLFSLLVLGLALMGCQNRPTVAGEIRVSCAASLSLAVQRTAESEGLAIALNAGGSNTLVRQAELGAPTDLLLLADSSEARAKLAPKGYRITELASNRLVVIGPRSERPRGDSFEQLMTGAHELAVADPATAPLGSYTDESLGGLTLTAKKVPLRDAKAVVSAVALGHSTLGIVYQSDAQAEPAVQVVCAVPGERHRAVRYVAVLPPDPSPSAQRLVQSLLSGRGREILAEQGFLPPAQ